jgi:hypothetical protein
LIPRTISWKFNVAEFYIRIVQPSERRK